MVGVRPAPRLIYVTIRHENPFFDCSYAVNSPNVGPYGDAITRELMPAVERSFRTIGARWARVTGGGSAGGWEAAAQMVFYPRLYSGAWVFCPDPLDFRGLEVVNIYDDPNAYYSDYPASLLPDPGVQGRAPKRRDAPSPWRAVEPVGGRARHARPVGSRRSRPLPGGVRSAGQCRLSRPSLGQEERGDRSRRRQGVAVEGPQSLPAEALGRPGSAARRQDVLLLWHHG